MDKPQRPRGVLLTDGMPYGSDSPEEVEQFLQSLRQRVLEFIAKTNAADSPPVPPTVAEQHEAIDIIMDADFLVIP
jgi:hypothetical protein